VTERKQASETLQESKALHRVLMEQALEGLIIAQGDPTRIVLANKAMADLTGYGIEELISFAPEQLQNLLYPDDRATFFQRFRDRLRGKKVPEHYEFRGIRKDGRLMWLAITSVRIIYRGKPAVLALFTNVTERKRAEQAAEKERDRLFSVLDVMPAFVYLQAPDYSVPFVNRKFKESFGDPGNTPCYRAFYGRRKPCDPCITLRVLETKAPQTWEWISQGGRTYMVHEDLFHGSDGREMVLGIGVDITDTKQAERELQDSEKRYRSLFEDSPISVWEEDFSRVKKYIDRLRASGVTDFRTYFERHPRAVIKCADLVKVVDVNKASLELYGAKKKEELTSGLSRLLTRESYRPFRDELVSIAQGKTVFEQEAITKNLQGDMKHVVLRWIVAPGYEETWSRVLVTIVDITERQETEESLRRQEEKYRTLVETAQEGIAITDHKENLTFVNQAFADLLGYRKDELLGKNLSDLSEESQYTIFKKETVRRKAGAVSRYEAVLFTKSKRSVPVYISGVPMTDEGGKFTGTLGILTDLTEIKKVQEYDVLLNASRALARSLNADEVLQVGAERLAQTLEADSCAVMLFDDKTPSSQVTLKVYPLSGKGGRRARTSSLKAGKGLLSSYRRSLQARRGIQVSLARRNSAPELARRVLRQTRMASALIIPVFQRNRMQAVFHVGTRRESGAFARDRVRLALTMANQVGAALQNCKLLEDVKREHLRATEQTRLLKAQYREQRMMFELAQLLTSTRSLDQLLKSAARKIAQLLRTERASVVLADVVGQRATIKAVYPQTSEQNRNALGHIFTAGAYPREWIQLIRENRPFVCSDVSTLPKDTATAKYFRSRGIKSTMAMPLVSRGKVLGFLTAGTTKKTHQYTQEEIRLLRAISDPVAVAIENYQLLEDLRQRYGQIEEQATTLKKQTWEKDILLRISQALSKAMSPDQVSRVASEEVGAAMGADRCAVLLAGPDRETLEVRALFFKNHPGARRIIGRKFPAGESRHLKESIGKGKTLVLHRPGRLPDIGRAKRYWLEAGIKSTLAAGMFFGRTLVGVLSISFINEDRTFTRDESKLIQAIANQIAIAVENARLLQEVEKHGRNVRRLAAELMNAQENVRKNIAQELHDHEGQMLLAMKMNLDRMQRDLSARPDHPKATEELLSDTRELLAQTIEEIRTLTFELSPPMLEDFGVLPALKWLIERFAKRSGIQFSLKTKGKERRYPKETEVALFRIAQEALANASKHARATEVSILVCYQTSGVVMSVRDNGVGFNPKQVLSAPRGEMGLLNIKERVDMLGGKFEIVSQPRKGTTLNINIPSSEVKHEEDQVVGR
jgi:PAS domain S-box-containing protein